MTLFKSRPGGPGKNTLLNYHNGAIDSHLFLIAEAFHEAAKAVVKVERFAGFRLDEGGLADFAAFPAVTLYRHAFELYLKSILLATGQRANEVSKRGHSLTALFADVGSMLNELAVAWDASRIGNGVRDLESVDEKCTAFRYGMKQDGTPAIPSRFAFSLLEFAKEMDAILDELAGVHNYVIELASMPSD